MKHVLTISENYVKHWDVSRALAELALNGVERAKECSESPFDFQRKVYDGNIDISFRNKNSSLSLKDLCLGNSTKNDHFGEGLKLAILTLVRAGKEVKIGFKDVLWTFSLEYNKKFQSNLLTLNSSKAKVSRKDLIIQVNNILAEEYEEYGAFFLDQEPTLYYENQYGKITTEFKGCYLARMNTRLNTLFGYSLNGSVLANNRERNVIADQDKVFSSLILLHFEKILETGNWDKVYKTFFRVLFAYGEDITYAIELEVIDFFANRGLLSGEIFEKYVEEHIIENTYYSDSAIEFELARARGLEVQYMPRHRIKAFENSKRFNSIGGVKVNYSKSGFVGEIAKKYSLAEEDVKTLKAFMYLGDDDD